MIVRNPSVDVRQWSREYFRIRLPAPQIKTADTVGACAGFVAPADDAVALWPTDLPLVGGSMSLTEHLALHDVILMPGIFKINEDVVIRRENAILIGVGYAM